MFSWFREKNNENQWKRCAIGSGYIADHVLNFATTIVTSTNCDIEQNGIVEFDTKTNKILNVTTYKNDLNIQFHCVCKCGEKMYIIDGNNGQIVDFDLHTKLFNKVKDIKNIGYNCNCITVQNRIYIVGGEDNNGECFMYNTKTNKVAIVNDASSIQICDQSILLYNQKLIKFGGYDCKHLTWIDTFLMSDTLVNSTSQIKWNRINEWTLPKPMSDFGVILIRQFLIIFGGQLGYSKYSNDIFVLDLNNSDNGWQKLSNIKCPIQSSYRAILTANNCIYLLSIRNNSNVFGYFSIPLRRLNNNSESLDLCDGNEMKYDECTECTECNALQGQLSTLQKEKELFRKEIYRLQNVTRDQQNQIDALSQKWKLSQDKFERLKRINVSNVLNWTSDDFVDWISTIENGKFKKHENALRILFAKENVNGSVITHISKSDWKEWGITDFMDRTSLHNRFTELINKNNKSNNDQNEGDDSTLFV